MMSFAIGVVIGGVTTLAVIALTLSIVHNNEMRQMFLDDPWDEEEQEFWDDYHRKI